MKKARVLFYIPEGNVLTNGVYASQILEFARYLVKTGKEECAILQYAPRGEEKFVGGALARKWARLKRMVREAFSRSSFIEKVELEPGITLFNDYKTRRVISAFRKKRFFMKLSARSLSSIAEFKPTHIYSRFYQTIPGAKYLAKKLGAKVVFSIRGEDVSESSIGGGVYNKLFSRWVRRSVVKAIKRSDHVNTVSNYFSEWLKKEYGCKASVMPCCAAGTAFVDEAKMEEHEAKTIVYSGGLWAWQKIDAIIGIMKKVAEVDDKIRFRFLTKDTSTLERKCEEIGLPKNRWSAKACKPSEVAGELAKADCGIIIRDDTMVNRVASPIKIAEYLAAGLGIVSSPCIGDVGRDLADKRFALLVDENTEAKKIVDFVNNLDKSSRVEAVEWTRRHFTYEGYDDTIDKMFE